jgi:NAD(P)H-hydrate epimerase
MDAPFWLSRAEVRELDRRAIEEFGVPGIVLMENAGRGATELLMRLNPVRKPVTILCGPGNNGGDGFVMARHLDNHGWPVRVFLFEAERTADSTPPQHSGTVVMGYSPAGLPPEARVNFGVIRRSDLEVAPIYGDMYPGTKNWLSTEVITRSCWLVDALFGTGLSRALASPFNEVVAAINASGNPVLAVDIPSGLDCDTGKPLGPTLRATHTATFVAWKKGFLQPEAKPWIGEVHVIDIGAPRKLVDEFRTLRT